MPAAVAIPGIVGALGIGASVFGAHKQSQAQNQARRDQQQANQQAMNYERNRARRAWDQYRKDYDAYYQRFGDKAVDRYGLPRGHTLPNAAPGADAAAPGGNQTLTGGRQIPTSEYDEYVKQREARRAGGVMPSPAVPAPEVGAFTGGTRSGFARGRGKRGGSTVGGLLGGGAGVKY